MVSFGFLVKFSKAIVRNELRYRLLLRWVTKQDKKSMIATGISTFASRSYGVYKQKSV